MLLKNSYQTFISLQKKLVLRILQVQFALLQMKAHVQKILYSPALYPQTPLRNK